MLNIIPITKANATNEISPPGCLLGNICCWGKMPNGKSK
jgi:hypothetical protein